MKIEKFVSRVESLFVKNRGKPYEEKVAFATTDSGHFVKLIFGKHSLDWQSLNEGDEIVVSAHVEGKKWNRPNGEVFSITKIVVDECNPLHCDEESVSWAFKTLGSNPGDSIDEIKSSYRNLMQTVHPDKFSSIEVSAAFMDELNKIAGNVSRAFNIISQIKK